MVSFGNGAWFLVYVPLAHIHTIGFCFTSEVVQMLAGTEEFFTGQMLFAAEPTVW